MNIFEAQRQIELAELQTQVDEHDRLERTLEIPLCAEVQIDFGYGPPMSLAEFNKCLAAIAPRAPKPLPVSREELVEFIRCIAEGESPCSSKKVHGQRAIELAAWDFYRRLQEQGEL